MVYTSPFDIQDDDPEFQAFKKQFLGGGTPQEVGGFTASAKQAVGSTIRGIGQYASDWLPGVEQDNALQRYGKSVQDANPTAIHSLSDFAENPVTGVKEALGGAAGPMGLAAGTTALGTGIGMIPHPAAQVVGRGLQFLGTGAGAMGLFGAPSQSSIYEAQKAADPEFADSLSGKLARTGASLSVGAIEQRFGPQEWAAKAMTKAGRDKLAETFAAKSLTGSIGKGALRGAAVEGAEELAQNPIEQLAGLQNPLSKENLKDTAFGGFMGAVGGGVLGAGFGGLSRRAPQQRPAAERETEAVNLLNPDSAVGTQGDLFGEGGRLPAAMTPGYNDAAADGFPLEDRIQEMQRDRAQLNAFVQEYYTEKPELAAQAIDLIKQLDAGMRHLTQGAPVTETYRNFNPDQLNLELGNQPRNLLNPEVEQGDLFTEAGGQPEPDLMTLWEQALNTNDQQGAPVTEPDLMTLWEQALNTNDQQGDSNVQPTQVAQGSNQAASGNSSGSAGNTPDQPGVGRGGDNAAGAPVGRSGANQPVGNTSGGVGAVNSLVNATPVGDSQVLVNAGGKKISRNSSTYLQHAVDSLYEKGSENHVDLSNLIAEAGGYKNALKKLITHSMDGLKIALSSASEKDSAIVRAALGWDNENHQVAETRPTLDEVGKQFGYKPNKDGRYAAGPEAVLKKFGVTNAVLDKMWVSNLQSVSTAELLPTQGADGEVANFGDAGFSTSDSIAATHVNEHASAKMSDEERAIAQRNVADTKAADEAMLNGLVEEDPRKLAKMESALNEANQRSADAAKVAEANREAHAAKEREAGASETELMIKAEKETLLDKVRKAIPDAQQIDIDTAAEDYNEGLLQDDDLFQALPIEHQVQWVKAAISSYDGKLSAQSLARIFGEIADANKKPSQSEGRSALAGVQAELPGSSQEQGQNLLPEPRRGAEENRAEEVVQPSRSESTSEEVTADGIVSRWNQGAKALGVTDWDGLSSEQQNYILGSGTWAEFDEAAQEVLDEINSEDNTFGDASQDRWSKQQAQAAEQRAIDAAISREQGNPTPDGRKPLVLARLKKILDAYYAGKYPDGRVINELSWLTQNLIQHSQDKKFKETKDRVRGADYFRQKLLEAKRNGWISEEESDFAEWVVRKNPALLDDLAVSIRSAPENSNESGNYNPALRLVTLFKEHSGDTTAVHEVLHHLERMLPENLREPIVKEWMKRLEAEMKAGRRDLVEAILKANAVPSKANVEAASKLMDSYTDYQLLNPSEFWAVNGTRILQSRFAAENSMFGRVANWMREVVEKLKSLFGMKSDAPLIRALDKVFSGSGDFVSGSMLSSGNSFNDKAAPNITQTNPQYRQASTLVKQTLEYLGNKFQSLENNLMFGHQLAEKAARLMPGTANYFKSVQNRQTERVKHEQEIARIANLFNDLETKQQNALNAFVQKSTMEGKWGFKPTWFEKDVQTTVDSAMKTEFDALAPEAQQIVKDMFKFGSEQQKRFDESVNANITDPKKKVKRNQMYGKPYSPLKRFGDHVVVGKSAAFVTEEQTNPGSKRLAEMKADPKHYYVEFTDGDREAIKLRDEMAAANTGLTWVSKPLQLEDGDLVGMNFTMLEKLKKQIEASDSKSSNATKGALKSLANQLYIQQLNQMHANKSQAQRLNVKGADTDMMRAFVSQGRAEAALIANLRTHAETESALQQIQKAAREGDNQDAKTRIANAVLRRHLAMLDFKPTPIQNKLMGANSFMMLLTSPAYYLTNATQPFVVSLPYMAGRFGGANSWNTLRSAYGTTLELVKLSTLFKNQNLDAAHLKKFDSVGREADALKVLLDENLVNIGMEMELGDIANQSKNPAWKNVQKGMQVLKTGVANVEVLNRLSTAVAGYRLAYTEALNKKLSAEDAHNAGIEYARKVIVETHGDYAGYNAPTVMMQGAFGNLPVKLMSQFKKFQFIQAGLLLGTFRDAYMRGNLNPTEKAAAKAMLKWMLGTQAALAGALGGVTGVPMAILGSILAGAFGDDGEDKEAFLRRVLGGGPFAQLILHGAPAAAGVDISKRVGMGAALDPFRMADPQTDWTDYALSFAGPSAGLASRTGSGLRYIHKGQYWKGLEMLMPSGVITNASKLARYESEGLTNSRGDVVMKPEEVSLMTDLMQGLGLETTQLSDRRWKAEAIYDRGVHFKEKTSKLQREYVEAFKDGDQASLAEVRQEWLKLQAERVKQGFKRENMATLTHAPMEQQKRERNTIHGLQSTQTNKKFVESIDSL